MVAVGKLSNYIQTSETGGVVDSIFGAAGTGGTAMARLRHLLSDRGFSGRLLLEPSRAVALDAKWLDRYLDECASFDVSIEVKEATD